MQTVKTSIKLFLKQQFEQGLHYLPFHHKFQSEITWDQLLKTNDVVSQQKYQGPVVQSVVSLTSLLRVISLTVLADPIYNILIFFAEKMWVVFALQKLLTFFQQKIWVYLRITWCKF